MKYIRKHINEDYVSSYDDETENDYDNSIDKTIENVYNELLNNKTPFFIALFNHCNTVHYSYSRMMIFKNICRMFSDGYNYKEEIGHIMNKTYTYWYELDNSENSIITQDLYNMITDFYKNNFQIIQFLIYCRGFVCGGDGVPDIAVDKTFIDSLGFCKCGLNDIYSSTYKFYNNIYSYSDAYRSTRSSTSFDKVGKSDMYMNILSGFKGNTKNNSDSNYKYGLTRFYKLDILFDETTPFYPFKWYKKMLEKYPEGFPVSKASGGAFNLNFVFYTTLNEDDLVADRIANTRIGNNGEIKQSSEENLQNQFDDTVKEFKQNSVLRSEFMKIENAINQQFSKSVLLSNSVSVHLYLYCGPSNYTAGVKSKLQQWYNKSYFCEQIF